VEKLVLRPLKTVQEHSVIAAQSDPQNDVLIIQLRVVANGDSNLSLREMSARRVHGVKQNLSDVREL
jgi:hypothetical protein